jgi:DsbC/DsbD-like thiol-disulfide interchange protein
MHGVMIRAMHSCRALMAAVFLAASVEGQSLAPKPSSVQHVAATAKAGPTGAGGRVTLELEVTPNPGIHVYAPGARDFTPVALVLTPRAGITVSKPIYPKADPPVPGALDDAPAYRKTFRIAQPVVISGAAGKDVVVNGVLNYQSCDERVCYPVASLPVSWTIK